MRFSGVTPLGDSYDGPVDEARISAIVHRTALRWETFLSGARAAFCAAVLVRLVFTNRVEANSAARLAIEAPLLVALVVFSIFCMLRARAGMGGEGLLVASASVDAVGCFLALVTNVVAPSEIYPGILRMPDVAAMLVVAMAAGLRLSPRATAAGAALHVVAGALLVALDLGRNRGRITYSERDIVLFALLLVSSLVLAAIVSTRARGLARDGGREKVAAERAQRNMWEVLQDSHEMRSALSAVALETDLFLKAAEKGEDLDRVGKSLREELAALNALVAGVRERTYAELAAKQGAARVPVALVVDDVVARTRARFPNVAIERHGGDDAVVLLAGGRSSLERIVSNLVVNACEGNGTAVPTKVDVEIAGQEGRVTMTVRDDGPGFADEVLAAPLDARGPTTKSQGSGLGLFFVNAIMTASGGALERKNREGERGAMVVVRFAP